MNLKDLGEFGYIDRIRSSLSQELSRDTLGIGDDCAVMPTGRDKAYLVTTDMLLEGSHFLFDKILPEDLGYKVLAVNLSDIAAMGGTPEAVFLSMALRKEMDVSWTDAFFRGFESLLKESKTLLLGGDTVSSRVGLVFNVTAIGHISQTKIKYRHGAKPGDVIAVTGHLGDAGSGLKIILEDLEKRSLEAIDVLQKHYRPRPHLKEGFFLADQPSVHAMMDVSDGIASDLQKICHASQVGAEVYLDELPLSSSLKILSEKYNWNPYDLAVDSGEDYCLLITACQSRFSELAERFQNEIGRPLWKIGAITNNINTIEYFYGNEIQISDRQGYDHFK